APTLPAPPPEVEPLAPDVPLPPTPFAPPIPLDWVVPAPPVMIDDPPAEGSTASPSLAPPASPQPCDAIAKLAKPPIPQKRAVVMRQRLSTDTGLRCHNSCLFRSHVVSGVGTSWGSRRRLA